MASILIEPIATTSKGGFPVTIDRISPTDHDCLGGSVDTPALGKIDGRWNLNGHIRDQDEGGNIDMSDDELSELADLAKQLGAR